MGLKVNGIYHRYTIEKDPTTDSIVRICNENPNGSGCTYLHIDDWSQEPGNTKIGYDPVSILGELLGRGSITVEGDGTITESIIHYDYTYDTCDEPLSDSRCPNYKSALLQYLLDNGLLNNPDVKDPYLDEYVRMQLDQKADLEEADGNKEEVAEEEEKEKEEKEKESGCRIVARNTIFPSQRSREKKKKKRNQGGRPKPNFSLVNDPGTPHDYMGACMI